MDYRVEHTHKRPAKVPQEANHARTAEEQFDSAGNPGSPEENCHCPRISSTCRVNDREEYEVTTTPSRPYSREHRGIGVTQPERNRFPRKRHFFPPTEHRTPPFFSTLSIPLSFPPSHEPTTANQHLPLSSPPSPAPPGAATINTTSTLANAAVVAKTSLRVAPVRTLQYKVKNKDPRAKSQGRSIMGE